MVRLIELLLVASVACRMLVGRWPWAALLPMLRMPAGNGDVARARSVLGVAPGASREAIVAAHHRIIISVHPDRGGSDALATQANQARDLLLAEITRHQQETA